MRRGCSLNDDRGVETSERIPYQRANLRVASRPRVLVVVNGALTKAIEAAELSAVVRILEEGGRVEVARTETVCAFVDAWNASPADRVVLIGGDGTVHAAANAVGERRELALIPAGSANNVARSLGIPQDPRAAAELAARGRAYPLDLIEARSADRSYLVVEGVSVGFLAQARSRYHASSSGHVAAAALARDRYALVVWVNPDPWIGPAAEGADGWAGYATERRELADFIAANRIGNILMLSGDAHMLAIDDGTNSDYSRLGGAGFPVMHAAALDKRGGVKGGPYSEGSFPGSGQFGLVTIRDDGRRVHVMLSGQDYLGREVTRYVFETTGGLAAR